jgi:hypothetical protein
MASKPKAGGAPTRRASAKAKPKGKTQSERFTQTARAFGVDETGGTFEKALTRLVHSRNAKRRSV